MTINPTDITSELKELHLKIEERRAAYDEGMKNGMEFGEIKKIFVEIKELEKRINHLFEHSNSQQGLRPFLLSNVRLIVLSYLFLLYILFPLKAFTACTKKFKTISVWS